MDSHPGGSREPHLLNLKVMRLSRPTLAKHSYPFALEPTSDSSEGVSDQLRSGLAAQRPSQALSLANGDPQCPDYVVPSVQDLSLTPMLTLPSSFGSINLGETFSAIICLSNDAPVPVGSARLVASMVLGNSTTVVGEIQPPPKEGSAIMDSGQNLEMMVSCEMRELGLHILQCAVEYASSGGPRTFTRSYRFNVTAPLNIKTKTHLSTSTNALLSPSQRDLVFLEIHMQNVSTQPMVFEKVEMEPITGMKVVKKRTVGLRARSRSGEDKNGRELFDDALEALAPGDTRQHLFALAPIPTPPFPQSSLFPPALTPGSNVPLGRLDLAWRGPFGERGQLLTSMLSRKVPLNAPTISIPPTRTVSALAGTPTGRPQSPFVASAPPTPPPKLSSEVAGWETNVAVIHCERHGVPLRKELGMKLRLAVGRNERALDDATQTVQLAVQYFRVTPAHPPSPGYMQPSPLLSSPSRSATPQPYSVSVQPPSRSATPTLSRVPTPSHLSRLASTTSLRTQTLTPPPLPMPSPPVDATPAPPKFPPSPVLQVTPSQLAGDAKFTGEVRQLGVSLLFLPKVTLQHLDIAKPQRDESPRPSVDGGDPLAPPPPPPRQANRLEGFIDFDITFVATKPGLAKLGGLRVIRLNDVKDVKQGGEVLREWESLGDVWVDGW